MSGYAYRQNEIVQQDQSQAPAVQTDAWGNAATAQSLGLDPETSASESQAIDDVWAWMNEEDGPQMCVDAPVVDPCAPSPLFPIDPALREAQGLPPSGMPSEACVVPIESGHRMEANSPHVQAQIDAEEEARRMAVELPFLDGEQHESRGRSRGGGSDSIRWRTRDPNHPSPYPAPRLPPRAAPMR